MISEKLKTSTAENHRIVEESGLMAPILNRTITKESYARILKKFYGFFHPLEITINTFSELTDYLPDFSERRKSEALIDDLKKIELQHEIEFSLCNNLPTLTHLSHAFGCLYVMEGSTLGGKMISRILNDTLNIDEASGAKFFTGYGPATGTKWNTFREALSKYSAETNDDELVVEAANDTFLKFKQWIDQD